MVYFLFVLYAAAMGYCLPKIAFVKKSGLRPTSIRALFTIKVLVCVVWGYINIHHFKVVSDPVALNELSAMEHEFLKSDPAGFLKDLFTSPYGHYGNFFGSINSYWNDLDMNLIAKTIAVFNFASTGNYYVNTLLGVFFSFFGHIALYRMYASIYQSPKLPIILGAFLIPTMLVFTASISKDNSSFTLLALTSFGFYQGLKNGFNAKKIIFLLLMLMGLLLIRNHLAVLVLPALMAWYISDKKKISAIKSFGLVYGLIVTAVGITSLLQTSLNPAKVIADKQAAFLALPVANSQLPMDTLTGSLSEMVLQTPQAINHGFLRPYPWEIKNAFNALLTIEMMASIFLMAIVLFNFRNKPFKPSPAVLYGIAIATTMIILTGFITPNYNTIARYKSIVLPFLLIPFIVHFSYWPKVVLRIRF